MKARHRKFPERWMENNYFPIWCRGKASLKSECGTPGQDEFDTPALEPYHLTNLCQYFSNTITHKYQAWFRGTAALMAIAENRHKVCFNGSYLSSEIFVHPGRGKAVQSQFTTTILVLERRGGRAHLDTSSLYSRKNVRPVFVSQSRALCCWPYLVSVVHSKYTPSPYFK